MLKQIKNWVIISLIVSSCAVDNGNYSIVPQIELKSAKAVLVDTFGSINKVVRLHFYVTDGDGDIGIGYNATGNDVFMNMYHYSDNIFSLDTANLNYSMPYIDNSGQDKVLKADIYINIVHFYMPYDTAYYEFYINDRAGHQSNEIITDTLVFP
jgi:hypothetical protein